MPSVSILLFSELAWGLNLAAAVFIKRAAINPVTLSIALPLVIIILAFSKLIILDYPLVKLENLTINFISPTQFEASVANGMPTLRDRLSLEKKKGWVRKYIADRAIAISENVYESRKIGKKDRDIYVEHIQGEVLAHILSGAFILAIFILTLHMSKGSLVRLVVACGSFTFLSIPYAYGKLDHSTYYEFGEFGMKEDGPKSANVCPDAHGNGNESNMCSGILLHQEDKFLTFLMFSKQICPKAPGHDAQYSASLKLLKVSVDAVLSIREITREDVIGWRSDEIKDCHNPELTPM